MYSRFTMLCLVSAIHQMTQVCCYCCSVTKLCLILCDPMDCSTPGSSVLYYLPEVKWKSLSCVQLFAIPLQSHGLYRPWNSLGQNTGVGSLALLQGMFPTQGLNAGFPHCRRILYHMSHKRSPRIQGWVAYPFSSRSSQPRNPTGVSCIAGGFFTNWAIREVQESHEEFSTVSRQE